MKISETAKSYEHQLCEMEIFPSFKYLLPYVRGKKVLDLGCGEGRCLEYFGDGSIGIDVAGPNLKSCGEKGLKVIEWDLDKELPFSGEKFEVVFLSHVIEHLDAPIQILRESDRVLEPGGLIIIGVPNIGGFARILGDHYFNDHEGHLYALSLQNIKVLLGKTGFRFKKLYMNLPLVKRCHLLFLMDLVQRVPFRFVSWVVDAIWVIGEKAKESDERESRHL